MRTMTVAIGIAVSMAAPARAIDRWEEAADDSPDTQNVLRHGIVQSHDLESAGSAVDQDWIRVVSRPRHSYSARINGLRWQCPTCPALLLQNATGQPVAAGSLAGDDVQLPDGSGLASTVAWVSSAGGTFYLRVIGAPSMTAAASIYDIQLLDTTLFVPRWNNSASQTTVLILQNTTNHAMGGSAYFYDAGGTLLATVDLSVPQHGVQVLQTAAIPALQGKSGSAAIAQAPYAALMGKAVALEPATGFTFDTPIVPLPY